MKNTMITTITIMLFLGIGIYSQESPETIVGKSISAMGGPEAIRQMDHYSATGEIEWFYYGRTYIGKFKQSITKNSQYRKSIFDFSGEKYRITDASDGKISWKSSNSKVSDKPILNHKNERAHSLKGLLNKYAKATILKGKEIDGNMTKGIELEINGKKTKFYFNSKNYFPVEITFSDQFNNDDGIKELTKYSFRYKNYQKQNGYYFPMNVTKFVKDKKVEILLFENIIFNAEIPDSLFKRPVEEFDFRYYEERME